MPRIGRSRPVSAYRPLVDGVAPSGTQYSADASATATATLTADATVTRIADASTTATATLTADATRATLAAASTTATATLTAAATRATSANAAATATAELTAAATRSTGADASTTATATLTAAAARATSADASITATATLTAAATIGIPPMAASITATATLTASASVTSLIGASTTATATLTAAASRATTAGATTTATATLTAGATRASLIAAETAVATATLTASASLQGPAPGYIIRRGQSPLMIVRDGVEAIAVYRGSRIIWDGTRPVIVGIPTAQATAFMPAPSTITGASAAIPPMMAIASMPEPAAIVNARVVIPVATATASMPAPSTVIPADTHVPVMSATASMPTPGVLITDTAIGQAPTMYATASMPAPTAVVNAGVTMPPMIATAFMPAPTGGIQTNIVIPPMTATASMPAPTPATGATTAIPPALASAFMLPPTVVAGANIIIPPMMATATMPAPTMTTTVVISDNFNRPSLGADWVTIGQTPVISAQRAQGGTTGASNATTAYAARHVTPLTQANQKVTCWVAKPAGTRGYAQGGGGFLRSTADGQNRAEIYATISGTTHTIGIKSYTAGTATVRASSTAYKLDMLPDSGTLQLCPTGLVLRAVGNVYTVWLNNSPTTISWTDSGNVVSQSNRHWGFVTYTTESSTGAATYSMAIARIDAEDYFPSTPVWETYEWMQPGWGTKTNGFGYYTGSSTTFHNAVDITTGGTTGRPIYAPADGIVLLAGGPSVMGSAYGNGASIWHEGDICTDYAHMVNPPPLVAGQVVTRGQVIGNVGSTGNSSEPHLHFAVRRGSYPFNGSAGAGTDDKWLMDTQFPYEDPEAFLRQVGVTINWAVNPG